MQLMNEGEQEAKKKKSEKEAQRREAEEKETRDINLQFFNVVVKRL
jgi:hypothetical protein